MHEGGVRGTVTVVLSFWDRVRVLFGARLRVFIDVKIEKDPGRVVSEESGVQVGRPPKAVQLTPGGNNESR